MVKVFFSTSHNVKVCHQTKPLKGFDPYSASCPKLALILGLALSFVCNHDLFRACVLLYGRPPSDMDLLFYTNLLDVSTQSEHAIRTTCISIVSLCRTPI